jgi:hypothetical protein
MHNLEDNPWEEAEAPPPLALRKSYSSTPARSLTDTEPHVNRDLPNTDPTDNLLFKTSLLNKVAILQERLRINIDKLCIAQSSHLDQVRENITLKEYVNSLLACTKKDSIHYRPYLMGGSMGDKR